METYGRRLLYIYALTQILVEHLVQFPAHIAVGARACLCACLHACVLACVLAYCLLVCGHACVQRSSCRHQHAIDIFTRRYPHTDIPSKHLHANISGVSFIIGKARCMCHRRFLTLGTTSSSNALCEQRSWKHAPMLAHSLFPQCLNHTPEFLQAGCRERKPIDCAHR